MAEQQVDFSERERSVLEKVAEALGMSVQEATEWLAKEGLARRVARKHGTVKVLPFLPRKV